MDITGIYIGKQSEDTHYLKGMNLKCSGLLKDGKEKKKLDGFSFESY